MGTILFLATMSHRLQIASIPLGWIFGPILIIAVIADFMRFMIDCDTYGIKDPYRFGPISLTALSIATVVTVFVLMLVATFNLAISLIATFATIAGILGIFGISRYIYALIESVIRPTRKAPKIPKVSLPVPKPKKKVIDAPAPVPMLNHYEEWKIQNAKWFQEWDAKMNENEKKEKAVNTTVLRQRGESTNGNVTRTRNDQRK